MDKGKGNRSLDPNDLLNTNYFYKNETVNKKVIQNNIGNYQEYVKTKNQLVDDFQYYTNYNSNKKPGLLGNVLARQKLVDEPWPKNGNDNQKPILSKTVSDLVEDQYTKYRITYINIDSRDRDKFINLKPNNYKIFLNRQFSNIESMYLADAQIPNKLPFVNNLNNIIAWQFPRDKLYSYNNNNLDNCDNIYTGEINNQTILERTLFYVQIPYGFYSTTELEKTIQNTMNTMVNIANPGQSSTCFLKYCTNQNWYVRINPITHNVCFICRTEEFKIKRMSTVRGKPYIEFELDVPELDCLTPAERLCELRLFCRNQLNLIATDFPDIGGFNDLLINKREYRFCPGDSSIDFDKCIPQNSFYSMFTPVWKTILGGECGIGQRNFQLNLCANTMPPFGPDLLTCDTFAPNELLNGVYRLYIKNSSGYWLNATRSESITDPNILANARIGTAQPFSFVFYVPPLDPSVLNFGGNKNLISEPTLDNGIFEKVEQYIYPFQLAFCNPDGSYKNLLLDLGFGSYSYTNLMLSNKCYIQAIQKNTDFEIINLSNIETVFNNFNDLETLLNRHRWGNAFLPKKLLNIYLGGDGQYYFGSEQFIFMKIIFNNQTDQNKSESLIKATSNTSSGEVNNTLYYNTLEEVDSFFYETANDNILDPNLFDPNNTKPIEKTLENVNSNLSVKDISNLFAKIKLTNIPQGDNYVDSLKTEYSFIDKTFQNFDELTVQFVDNQGRILDLRTDYNFTIAIVEKLEVLKDTLYNSRTGQTNTTGNNLERIHNVL
jgi:hypothetical protein